jgi:hypothetical protein
MCHHHRHRTRTDVARTTWAAPPAGPIRAGDADRERVVEALRVHAGAGRLDAEELERRIERAYAATYVSDLDAIVADLPRAARSPHRGRGRPTSAGPERVVLLLAVVAALVVVTTLTGVYALWWLMWPVAMVLHGHGGHRRRGLPAPPGPAAG